MTNVFTVTVKALSLFASITVLPYWLAIYQKVPVLYAFGGAWVLAVFLAALWTGPRSGTTPHITRIKPGEVGQILCADHGIPHWKFPPCHPEGSTDGD